MLKLKPDGSVLWERTLFDSTYFSYLEEVQQIVQTADSKILLAGTSNYGNPTAMYVDFDGNWLASSPFNGSGTYVQIEPLGNFWYALNMDLPPERSFFSSSRTWEVLDQALQPVGLPWPLDHLFTGFAIRGSNVHFIGTTLDTLLQRDVTYEVFQDISSPVLQTQLTLGEKVLNSDEFGYSVRNTPDGGYLVSGDRATEQNGIETWLLKLNEQGNVLWTSTLNLDPDRSEFERSVDAMEVLPDGSAVLLIVSNESGNLVKVSKEGNVIWQKKVTEDPNISFFSSAPLCRTPEGGFATVITNYWVDDTPGPKVFKFNDLGDTLWTRRIGGDQDISADIVSDVDGNLVFCGGTRPPDPGNVYRYWVIKVNGVTGEVIWEKTYGDVSANNAREIKQGPDGRYYAIGLDRPTQGPTSRVAYVVCIDPATGNAIWEKRLNDTIPESWIGYTLDFDPNGHLFVQNLVDTKPGTFPVNFYLGVSKLDMSGNILCQEIIDNGHDNDIFDGVATPDGGYIAVGSASPVGIDYDVILIKTDPNCLVSTIPLDLKQIGGVSAYPNPGSQQFRLVFQSPATGDVFINVLTSSGRQVGSYVSQKNGDEWSMDISTANWPPGAYLIETSCGKVRSTTVWVKH